LNKNIAIASIGTLFLLMGIMMPLASAQRLNPGKPEVEAAFYEGETYYINAILVEPAFSNTPRVAQADLYIVNYVTKSPTGTQSSGHPPLVPFAHDHILDSVPGDKDFRALWHVYLVFVFDPSIPLSSIKSESELVAAITAGQAGGMVNGTPTPGAAPFDTDFVFLCAVVPAVSA
jgi:hypothetical protein